MLHAQIYNRTWVLTTVVQGIQSNSSFSVKAKKKGFELLSKYFIIN